MEQGGDSALAPDRSAQLQALLARDLQLDRVLSDLTAGQCALPAQSLAVLVCAAAHSGLTDKALQLAAAAGVALGQDSFFVGLINWVHTGLRPANAPRWQDDNEGAKETDDEQLGSSNASVEDIEVGADAQLGCGSSDDEVGAANSTRKRTAAAEVQETAVGNTARALTTGSLPAETGAKRQKLAASSESCIAVREKQKPSSEQQVTLSLQASVSVRDVFPQYYRGCESDSDEASTDSDDDVQPPGSFLESVYSSDEDDSVAVLSEQNLLDTESTAGEEQGQHIDSLPPTIQSASRRPSVQVDSPSKLPAVKLSEISHVQSSEPAAATIVLTQVSSPEFVDSASMKLSKLGRDQLAMQQQQQQQQQRQQRGRGKASVNSGRALDVTDAFFQMELCP